MANDNINKGTFDDLINEFNGVDKCCFIDTASVISGIAKFSVPVLKTKSIKIDPSLFIWFVGSLFLRILMNEKDTHGNKSFVCVIRECSIIPKDIMKQLGFHENICYICRILSGMREQIVRHWETTVCSGSLALIPSVMNLSARLMTLCVSF